MPIPKVKDPVIQELQRICETQLALPTTFMEANLAEANYGLDELTDVKFPVLIYVTNKGSDNEFNEAGEVQRTLRIYALLLNRVDNPTTGFDSSEVNATLYQVEQLAQNLQYWINRSPLSVDGGVDKWKSDNLYAQFDAHLFGKGLDFQWKVNTGTSGYYNRGY
jgi:hypothetical protein